MIRQVSSQLLSPTEKLKVQLSVGLIDSHNNPSYCSIYNMGGASYLNITPLTHIVIKYVEKGKPWSRWDNLYINQRNIFGFRVELKSFYDNMMAHADDIYQYGSNGYIISMGNVERYKQAIVLGPGQIMQLQPATLYDEKGKPLPGIFMEINQKSNLIELSMEEFESFYDLFRTINIHQEGMILLQTYMMVCLKNGGLKIPVDKNNISTGYQTSEKDVRVNIFEQAQKRADEKTNEEKESVIGNFPQKEITTLEELG